jgi:hypothetical protein
MPHLIELTSCWKGTSDAAVWTETLTPSVFASGPNGCGKSRLAEAAELLLTGGVSNYCGRPGPVKEALLLWRSKPKGEAVLFVGGTLDNGDKLRWAQERATGRPIWTRNGVKIEKGQEPGVVQTVAEIRSNLFGKSATAEKWLAGKLGLSTVRVLARVKATEAKVRAKIEDGDPVPTSLLTDDEWALINAVGNTDPKALLDMLGKRQRSAADEAKGAARVVTDMEFAVGIPVTDAELAGAEAAVAAAEVARKGAAGLSANMQGLIAAYTDFQRESAALATLPAVDAVAQGGLDVARSIAGTLDVVAANYPANDLCPCCKTNVGAAALGQRRDGLRTYIDTAQATADAAAVRQRCVTAVSDAQTRIQKALLIIPTEAVQQLQRGQFTDPTPAADAAVATAKEVLDGLQRRRIATQAPGMAETAATAAETRSDSYKRTIKVVEKALAAEVRDGLKILIGETSNYFPGHFGTPVITLRPRVELGVNRDGTTGAPSGGEETLLLLALAGALAQSEAAGYEHDRDAADLAGADFNEVERLHMLVAEDRSLDAEVINAALLAFGDWPAGQVFLPTTTPIREPVEGWTSFIFWPPEEGAVPTNGAGLAVVEPQSLDLGLSEEEEAEVDAAMADVFATLGQPPTATLGQPPTEARPDVVYDFATMTPIAGYRCSVCKRPVYQINSGDVCPSGFSGCGAGGVMEAGEPMIEDGPPDDRPEVEAVVPDPVPPNTAALEAVDDVNCVVCGDTLYRDGSGVICVKGHRPEIHAAFAQTTVAAEA